MSVRWRKILFILVLLGLISPTFAETENRTTVVVGSKKFTESVILGEIVRLLADSATIPVVHKKELGGTRILWNGLLSGEIDIYPEYTGTLRQEIFVGRSLDTPAQLRAALATKGLTASPPLGFNNTYAIGVTRKRAESLGLKKISDLKRFPDLVLGFGSEFLNRHDGWPGLKRHYGLPQTEVRGLDHDLAYRAIATGTLDAIDLYNTDAEISYYDIHTLEDDRQFFPDYNAVILYRSDLVTRAPELVSLINQLAGRINEHTMVKMNSQVKLQQQPDAHVASEFVTKHFGVTPTITSQSAWQRLITNTRDHLLLVVISLSAAIVVAVPLGIWSARRPRAGKVILGTVSVIQTIPSLALFVFMIPVLGIGGPPAVAALFLYSLLPIIRNTYSGLRDITPAIHDSAIALGLPDSARLRLIELPLAARTVMAGIKTSAVINVGTATLAALIGAGGYGQPILTGIRLDDIGLILQGAVPAALLALAVQGMFEFAERWVVPKGLRLGQST